MSYNLHKEASLFNSRHHDGSSNGQARDKGLPGEHQMALELERLHELRRQVAAQEQKLQSLRQQAANSGDSHSLMTAEQGVMKSLIFTKEKELALALMKVAELTSQLEHLRRSHVEDAKSKSRKRIETSGTETHTEPNQQKKGTLQKAIPIKVIRESVHLNHDAGTRNLLEPNTDEESKSEQAKSFRVIPIRIEKTVAVSDSTTTGATLPQGLAGVKSETTFVSQNSFQAGQDVPLLLQKDVSSTKNFGADARKTNYCATGKESEPELSADEKEIGDERNAVDLKSGSSAQSTSGIFNEGSSSKTVEKVTNETFENEKASKKKAETETITGGGGWATVMKFENEKKMQEKNERSISKAVSANSTAVDKKIVNCNKDGILSDENKYEDFANSRNDDKEVMAKDKKNAVNTIHSTTEGKDNDMHLLIGERDSGCVEGSSSDKKDDAYSNKPDENTAKTFLHDKKSFSDFSLCKLAKPRDEGTSSVSISLVRSASHTGKTAIPCSNGASDRIQPQPVVACEKARVSGIRSDRARFFMDMVKEDNTGMQGARPWLDTAKRRVAVEFRHPTSPTVSSPTVTSRGRSSSSAIMSRFAPQPYGRSKSVDSGSLRVPMMTLSGNLLREQSLPDSTVGDGKTDSANSATVEQQSLSPGFPTALNMHSCTSSPVQFTQEKSDIFSKIPVIEPSISSVTSIAVSPLPLETSDSSEKPSYSLETVSLSLFPQQKANIKQQSPLAAWTISDSKPCVTRISPFPTVAEFLGEKAEVSRISTSTSKSVSIPSIANLSSPTQSILHPLLGQPVEAEASSKTTTYDSKPPVIPIQSKAMTLPEKSILCVTRPPMPITHATTTASRCEKLAASAGTSNVLLTNMSPANASMPQSASTLLNTCMSLSTEALREDGKTPPSIASSADVTKSALASSSVIISDGSLTQSAAGTSLKSSTLRQTTDSKCEDSQLAEEMSNTTWDSNVKRLAHIYAVTIGGSVKGKPNFQSGKSRGSSHASSGASISNHVPQPANVPRKDVTFDQAENIRTEQYSKEQFGDKLSLSDANVKLGVISSAESASDHSPPLNRVESLDVDEVLASRVDVLEQSKIDTSADSVSSALSVLLRSNSSAHSSPVRPSRLRTTISSAYRRKLGSGAMDNYSQNMTLLYGDHIAKNKSSAGSDTRESSTDSVLSPPVLEPPLEDLPRILALDTLDGMPFYPRIGTHFVCRDNQASSDGIAVDSKAGKQSNGINELLKTADVELTVVPNPVQTADFVHIDSAESLKSFTPSDDLVPSFIDDPAVSDDTRCASEIFAKPLGRCLTKRDGKARRHVTFDNVSLLLNAALEGEKDVVVDIISKVVNPNHKTENGVSALHNAVCGNHADVVKFLVEFGCDINAADSDGWTPLHCAASSNSLELMQTLVENGASILPMTISDRETPVQKCSRNLPGYEEAVSYLNDVAKSLGAVNDGLVYVTSNFTNVCSDELVLCDGERMKILRRGDDSETEWWWAKRGDKEGYVPQSLLALYPRVSPKWVK